MQLLSAMALYALGRREEVKNRLLDTMSIALPHGFITPFAELVTSFGGLMEKCLEEKYPDCYGQVLEQWKRSRDELAKFIL